MALSEADRVEMLEALAQDESLKATQRLRALEELGRMESRKAGGDAGQQAQEDDVPPDPMADLDEMERQRLKRSGGRRATA